MTPATPPPLILASQSRARRAMLEAAGLAVVCEPARLDETALAEGLLAEGAAPRDVADALAEAKALKVSRRHPLAFVIGADQVLVASGRLWGKPGSVEAARAQLRALRGGPHELLSAAVVAQGGTALWRSVGRARLTMRDFSDDFLEEYLAREGEAVTGSAGAYRIEGPGVQLFRRIDGDHFTIMGLPLLDLLDYLRVRGVCRS